MKLHLDEKKGILLFTGIIGLYDLITLSSKTILATILFCGLVYYITQELMLVALVLLTPQFVSLINKLINNNKKEKFTDIETIQKNVKKMKDLETFTNLNEVSNRVKTLLENKESVNNEVSASEEYNFQQTLDVSPYQKDPTFMSNDLGVDVNINGRIHTKNEKDVPKVGTLEKNPLENPYVSNFDDESLNIALVKTTNNNSIHPANLNSVEL